MYVDYEAKIGGNFQLYIKGSISTTLMRKLPTVNVASNYTTLGGHVFEQDIITNVVFGMLGTTDTSKMYVDYEGESRWQLPALH